METRAEPLGFLLESDWIEVKKMEATRGLRPTASQVAASLGILQEGSSIVFRAHLVELSKQTGGNRFETGETSVC